MSPQPAVNAAQIANWNGAMGRSWVELRPLLDRQLGPATDRALEALGPSPGERILDVGCGAGRSSLRLVARVRPGGSVVGVDVSGPMLEVARACAGAAEDVAFLQADASSHRFDGPAFDALFSAFGVMFFDDPARAFANLARALRPGARLAFLCWRSPRENPIMTLPMEVARHHFPASPPPDPHAPGPFAFADPSRVRGFLEAAGFSRIEPRPLDLDMGGNSLDEALELALRLGPLGGALREHPEHTEAARADVRRALEAHLREGKVWLSSATWIVTASRS